MKKKLTLITASLINFLFINAQTIDLNWSDKQLYDNKKDGFFNEFAGGNSKYVYAKYNKVSYRSSKANSKVKLVAYDKKTMDQEFQVPIKGYKENEKDKELLKGLNYYSEIVFENSVIVFLTKTEKGVTELYAQIFDEQLKSKIKLKKIYEVKTSGKKSDPNLFVIGNQKAGEKIIIGAELPREKSENVKFEYKVLKSDLTYDAANQITLPYATKQSTNYLSASYEIGDDGKLYVKTYISMDKEERKQLKPRESATYNLLTVVDLSSGKYQSFPFKFDGKNLFQVDYLVTKNKTKVYGLFSDLDKDKWGRDLHGIFYAEIDNNNTELTAKNFTYFDKKTLDKLFAKDKKDQKKAGKLNSKKDKKSNEESLAGDYTIEYAQSVDNTNVVLFTSRMYNYSVTTCDGKGNCTTRYYCQKSNVTAFKVDNSGNLIWASNLDRQITYNGWNIYDVNVVSKDEKLYTIYGSAFQMNASKKNMRSSKSRKQQTDRLEYAIFDYNTGAFTKDEYQINAINTKKKDKKFVSPTNITVLDNQMYINASRVKIKPLPVILGCLGGIVCFPVAIIPFMSGSAYKGTGYVGNITPVK